MVTWYSTYTDNIDFNELLWNYEFINLLSLKIGPFYKNFILQNFGAIRYTTIDPYNYIVHTILWLVTEFME